MEFTVIEGDSKAVVKISDKGMILLQFYWRDTPAKSKKGNLNMCWCSEVMFAKIIKEFNDIRYGNKEDGEKEPEIPL